MSFEFTPDEKYFIHANILLKYWCQFTQEHQLPCPTELGYSVIWWNMWYDIRTIMHNAAYIQTICHKHRVIAHKLISLVIRRRFFYKVLSVLENILHLRHTPDRANMKIFEYSQYLCIILHNDNNEKMYYAINYHLSPWSNVSYIYTYLRSHYGSKTKKTTSPASIAAGNSLQRYIGSTVSIRQAIITRRWICKSPYATFEVHLN